MTAGAILHRVLARCLIDPVFLQRVEDHGPGAFTDYDLDEAAAKEFQAIAPQIAKYAGLVATVQNNGLWQYIPATRLLLKRYGLDLKAFVAFRAQHQANRAQRGLDRNTLTASFFSFFERLLSEDADFNNTLLVDVFFHERTMWEMERAAQPQERKEPGGSIDANYPAINGSLRLMHYHVNPIQAVQRIVGNEPDVGSPEAAAIGYWRNPSDRTLKVMTLTPAAADLLSRADGTNSYSALVESALAERDAERAEIIAFLDHCIAFGLLSVPGGAALQPASVA
jgi:hypothetical protein